MWHQDTSIAKELLTGKESILIKYNCALCSASNEVHLQGFYLGYFTSRPNYVWDAEVECRGCEGSNSQIINIKYTSGYLGIDIGCTQWEEDFPLKVDPTSIHYSFDAGDISNYVIEIPFELDWAESIIGNDSYANYIASVTDIRDLLNDSFVKKSKVLLKLLYANVISIFETYLFDLIVNAVNSDEKTLRKVIQNYKIFKNEKIEKSDIFSTLDTIKNSTIDKLKGLIYHNLGIIIPLYKDSLDIDFLHLINGLSEAISIRHDLVHRNGRDFSGNEHDITLEKILSILQITNDIVDFVHSEFGKKGIEIIKKPKSNQSGTDDLPF